MRKLCRVLQFKRFKLAIALAIAFSLFPSHIRSNAAQQKAAAVPAPAAPAPPVAIPLADIATRATEVSNLLGKLIASAAPSAQIESIAKTLSEFSEKLDGQLANAHSRILKMPPPNAFLLGYGDSSINFELRAWMNQSSSQTEIRSELATAVYDAVQAAGMSFPFPQREVRLLRDAEENKRVEAVKLETKV